MLGLLDAAYLSELKPKAESSTLLVLFSSSLKHVFYKYDFGCNILYIADKNYTYFTEGADALSGAIVYAARTLSCNKVVTLGASKGGYAALLHAAMGAAIPEMKYHAIAFGPQTLVYPQNHNIDFPSYLRLMKIANGNERLLNELRRFGRLPDVFPSEASADIYFSDLNSSDRMEALRLRGSTVKHVGLPMTGHLCHLPFMVDTTDTAAVTNLIEKAYAQAKVVGDQPDDQRGIYINELLKMPRQPDIVDLVKAAISSD